MKNLCLLMGFLCLLQLQNVLAQSIHEGTMEYAYDAAGNRISRTVKVAFWKTSPLSHDSVPPLKDSVVVTDMDSNTVINDALSELMPNVYPNPTTGIVTIDLLYNAGKKEPVNSVIEIRDSKSSLIQRVLTRTSRENIQLDGLPTGIYHLIIKGEKKQYIYIIQKN